MPDCPAPDCDYEGASLEAVKGHWGGSQDAQHQGKWHEAFEAYNDAQGSTAETQADAQRAGASEASESDVSASSGPKRLELPTPDTDSTDSHTEATDDSDVACPECGDDRADTVGNASSKMREMGIDPDPLPDDAYVCYNCWVNASSLNDITVYE